MKSQLCVDYIYSVSSAHIYSKFILNLKSKISDKF